MGSKMKQIIDVACGGKAFYFDKNDDRVEFCDKYPREMFLCDGRYFKVSPDNIVDFTDLPYENESFNLVIFDPPHLKVGDTSYMAAKYGRITEEWKEQFRDGFSECFRILKPGGTLIFKWCESSIALKEVLSLTENKPVFGNRNPKGAGTHWIVFYKEFYEH